MHYSIGELRERIIVMCPGIERSGVTLRLVFDRSRDLFFISLGAGPRSFGTHLRRAETDLIMADPVFAILGSQINHWLADLTGRYKKPSAADRESVRLQLDQERSLAD